MGDFFKNHKRVVLYIFIIAVVIELSFYLPSKVFPSSIYHKPEYQIDLHSYRLSFISLGFSVIIAFLIYDLGNAKADREKRNRMATAKRLMLASLEDGIYYLISTPEYRTTGPSHSIADVFKEYRDEYACILSTEEYIKLDKVVSYIDSVVNDADYKAENQPNVWLIFPSWIDRIRSSSFCKYLILAGDEHDLLTTDMVELLNKLGARIKNHEDINKKQARVCGNENFVLLERDGDHIIIRSSATNIVCDGIFGDGIHGGFDYEIEEGYAETAEYHGYVKNCMRDGEGKSFNEKGEVVSEGIWSDDKLVEGTEYRWIIEVNNKNDQADDNRIDIDFRQYVKALH